MARIAQIVSTARYLPERVVTNAELTTRFTALGNQPLSTGLRQARVSPSVSTPRTTG